MPRPVRRLLVVLAVVGAGLVPAPADAALCSGSGVNVVVDYGALGGGVDKRCGTGSTAAEVFRSAGVDVTRVQKFPGAVCTVEGRPDTVCYAMPPDDAYWGLFWSDGTGHWVYSTVGVDGLKVPDRGFVAFAWQSTSTRRSPDATPLSPRPSSPSPTPTKKPASSSPTKKPGATTAPRSATPSASASTSATASASTSPSGTASPSTTASAGAAPSTDVSPPASATATGTTDLTGPDEDGGGLPWWVPVAVLVGLGGGGGAAWWSRRPRTT